MIRVMFLFTCLVFFVAAQMPSMTDWRGLSPLKSTKMDVERTLGPPDTKRDDQMTYYLPDVTVFFYFSANPNCEKKLPYGSWDVPLDTVTSIDISLRYPPLIAATGIDLTKFEKIKGPSDMIGSYIYLNRHDGFSIQVSDDYVAGYQYAPGRKQQKLRCKRSDEN